VWWFAISWLFTIGVINLILFFIGIVLFIPRDRLRLLWVPQPEDWTIIRYVLVIMGIVGLHLFEVNVIDPFVNSFVPWDFASVFVEIEDSYVVGMVDMWHPWVVAFFVVVYIAVYPFTLWFSVLYFFWCREVGAMRTLVLGLVIVYMVALPFYLFFPVSNVYTFFDSVSALEVVIPGVEQFFYSTTTWNNCFPSLHTAMTLMVAVSVWQTGNRRFGWFTWLIAVLVIISVIYLAIHWIVDVVAGILVVFGVSFILQRWFGEKDFSDYWFRYGGEKDS
jgi:membrane-associated phospholipid phosphatase